jgi:hypothetical protein
LLQNGETVQSDVSNYGAGLGLKVVTPRKGRWMGFGFVLGLWDINDGNFTFGGATKRSENRIHTSLTGDYGAGVMFFPTPAVGVEVRAGYTGQFKQDNADENVHVNFGVVFLSPRMRF